MNYLQTTQHDKIVYHPSVSNKFCHDTDMDILFESNNNFEYLMLGIEKFFCFFKFFFTSTSPLASKT
jgi:hypothetical protein